MEYCIIVFTCLVVYFRSLRYGTVVDDVDNRKNHDRPSVEATRKWYTRLRRKLSGEYPVKNIELDHFINIVINTTNCVLVYACFGSLPAALLFSVCVSNNQVSLWLNGKRYGISAMLCMLAYLYSPWGIGFWLLTPFFQASALSFPILLALLGKFYFFPIVLAGLLMGNKFIINWAKDRQSKTRSLVCKTWDDEKLVFILKTIAYYFVRGIGAYTPNMYPKQFKRFGIYEKDTREAYRFDIQAFAGLLLISLIPVAYVINPVVFIGALFWLVTILVYGNWVTITVPLAERYMYLPNIGLMVFVAKVLSLVHPLAWVGVFIFYLTRHMTFMPMYKDMNSYLKHHTYWFPENDQAWVFRANYHANNGDVFGVMHLANEGLLADIKSPLLWLHKARGFAKIGRKDVCNQAIRMARDCSEGAMKEVVEKEAVKIESQL